MKELNNLRSNYTQTYGFSVSDDISLKPRMGIDEDMVKQISSLKNEPQWMTDFRIKSYKHFAQRSMPQWGADLNNINFDEIYYYIKPKLAKQKTWEDVPKEVKDTFEKLGVPQAERKFLAGVEAQFDSEAVYGSLLKEIDEQGIIFTSTDNALKQYPELFKKYFGTVVDYADNKFSALNSAVWSGGSFLYVPKKVKVKRPLQAYFRINAEKMGQFERTLIIIDEGAEAHYIVGCTAPTYSDDMLHSAVVEVFVKKNARFRYTTIQNWSDNVYNLVTKRAYVEENGIMEWIDGNLGSKANMKYPSCILAENGAHGEVLSIAYAGPNQVQDAGAKIFHLASNTTSKIVSKSVSSGGGNSTYRGLIQVSKNAKNARTRIECDALILDEKSISNTFPTMKINNNTAIVEHEASAGKISEEKMFYLQSRGLSEEEAMTLVVSGFIEPIVKELPLEYALELNRLIELEMEGSVG